MDKTQTSFQAALREWAGEERRGLAEALPSPEDLVALRDGKLEPEAEEALRHRLALHPAAAREFLDLTSFAELEAPGEEYRLSDREVESQLAALRARIGTNDISKTRHAEAVWAAPMAEIVPISARRYQRVQTMAWASSIAAVLAVFIGTFWVASLDRRLDEATGPRFTSVLDIQTVRGERELTVSPDVEWIELLIHDVDMRTFARGELVVAGIDGEVLHRREFRAVRRGDSFLAVPLPRARLPDGSYRIEVYGLDSRGQHLLKEDRFAIKSIF